MERRGRACANDYRRIPDCPGAYRDKGRNKPDVWITYNRVMKRFNVYWNRIRNGVQEGAAYDHEEIVKLRKEVREAYEEFLDAARRRVGIGG